MHSESLDDKSVELSKSLAGAFNRQVVRPLVWWNYGPDAPMPTWGLDTDEEKDLTERLAIDRGVQAMGYPITQRYVEETYGVPKPQPEDVVLVPNAAAGSVQDPTVSPNFSEGTGRQLADQQLAQFDQLARQMQKESLVLLGERTRQVVTGLTAGRKG